MTDPLLERAERIGAIMPDFYMLYIFAGGSAGPLLALYHHPNRLAMEAKRRECQEAGLFAGRDPHYRIVRYAAREETK